MRAAEICKLRPFTITENFGTTVATIASVLALEDELIFELDELDLSLRELEELVAISC